MLAEKKHQLQVQLQNVGQVQDQELKRLNAELQTLGQQLIAARRDFELQSQEYNDIKFFNDE